jgi:thiamine kinase-like enzyme
MQNLPLGSIDEITPMWLTQVLRDGGHLTRGTVSEIQNQSLKSNWARNAVLRLSYSADAMGEKPEKLFFKLCDPGPDIFGDSEIIYYSTVAAEISDPPIPRHYHSGYSKERGNYHLLLEDLSDTHAPDIQPTWALALNTVTSMAQLHAAWWNHPRLSLVGDFPDQAKIEKNVSYSQKGLAPMLDEIGAEIPQEWHTLIYKIFDAQRGKMVERAGGKNDLTFIHGDLNPGNVLSPIGNKDRIYLIDHQPFDWSLTIWLGVSDLAYWMVHWWDSEMRQQWERPLLEHYHRQLSLLGIHDYTFHQLWDDYRLCAMQSLYVATSWCVNPSERKEAKGLWSSQLKKTMAACIDLKCIELLQ